MGPARWRFFVLPRGPRGATRFVSKDSRLCLIVAARDEVIVTRGPGGGGVVIAGFAAQLVAQCFVDLWLADALADGQPAFLS